LRRLIQDLSACVPICGTTARHVPPSSSLRDDGSGFM